MGAAVVSSGLSNFQETFAEAIFSNAAPLPAAIHAPERSATASRFGVYRNNVILGLTNALAARYPVVRRLLWDDSFNAVARLYVTAIPPRLPVLLEYGEGFPDFIRNFGEGVACDYLADIAEIESARTRAYHATDVTPMARSVFADVRPDRLAGVRLKLHPSMTLLKSRFPVVSVWESQQSGRDAYIREWKREAALIARPHWDVEVRRLPDGAYEFFKALSEGETVAVSIEQAIAGSADFDLAAALATLIESNIVVGSLLSGVRRDRLATT